MIAEAVIAAALLGRPQGPDPERAPRLSHDRLTYLADAIARAAGDDIDIAAALITNGERESSWRRYLEACAVSGLGGWGAFGVADIPEWRHRYPGATCGSISAQAKGSRGIWAMHYRLNRFYPRIAFGRYIGARAGAAHPEAQARARIFWNVRAQLECACSI